MDNPEKAESKKALALRVEAVMREAQSAVRLANKAIAAVESIDLEKVAAYREHAEKRLKDLADMLQIEYLKQSVCSEVTRLDRTLWLPIIKALDQPDKWWKAHKHLTIAQWADEFRRERLQ